MISNKYKKMCEVYRIFAKNFDCDLSDQAMLDMYNYESSGIGDINISGFNGIGKPNGYAVGKKWLNVQVSAWLNDFEENRLFARMVLEELYLKKEFPKWWLDSIFIIPEFENMIEDIFITNKS